MYKCDAMFLHWLGKNEKNVFMFVLFSRLFGHFESLAFFENGGQTLHKAVKQNIQFNFERYNNKVTIFKKLAILTEK